MSLLPANPIIQLLQSIIGFSFVSLTLFGIAYAVLVFIKRIQKNTKIEKGMIILYAAIFCSMTLISLYQGTDVV